MGMKFNEYFKNKFEGCKVLAQAYDMHRNRDVTIYLIPGEFDVVGVSDGTDYWAAPTCVDPFSVSVKRMIEDIKNGKEPTVTRTLRQRAISTSGAPASEVSRPAEEPQPATTGSAGPVERRRIVIPQQEPLSQQLQRRRLHS